MKRYERVTDNLVYFQKLIGSFTISVLIIGCLVNWLIHKSRRVKEKSWAMLSAGVLYWISFVYCFACMIEALEDFYPELLQPFILMLLPVAIFFSGTTAFTLCLWLWISSIIR